MIRADDLIGIWHLHRTVTGQGTMTGSASFSDHRDGQLLYQETGQFVDGAGGAFRFSRRYLYVPTETGLRIMFDEDAPRLFQDIFITRSGDALRGIGHHDCHPDEYRSAYEFVLPDRYRTTHVVTGPRKNYTIDTSYHRPRP